MYESYPNAVPITPHDSTTYHQASAIWVGGAGVVQVILPSGAQVAFTAVAGSVIPVANKRVHATGTTATLLVALYR